MPERPEDFEDDVRDALEHMAAAASPPSTPPPSVLGSARRRLARNSIALLVSLSMLVGGVVVGLQLADRGQTPPPLGSETTAPPSSPTPDGTRTTTPSRSPSEEPSPSPTETVVTGGTGTGPIPVMLFIDGVIYRYLDGTKGLAAVPVGSIPEATAVQPPVSTPFGTVVLGGQAGHETHLWFFPSGGVPAARLLIDSGVDGFAVSADGATIAYAGLNEHSTRSVLHEYSMPPIANGSLAELPVDTYVRVIGYAGDRVVLETGDGAAAAVATWQPGASAIVPLDRYGTAVGTDPETGLAVLNQGDGTCWALVRIGPTGQAGRVGRPKLGECGALFIGVSFEPGGATIAGVELRSQERTGTQIVVVQGTESQLGGALDLPGPFQTLWVGRGRYLVMAEPDAGHLTVVQCRVSENMCPDPPVWTASASGGEGSAWIVEERPAS